MDRARLEYLLGGIVPLVYMEQTGSTNDDAKRLILAGEAPALVVAGSQTAGRGRRGKTFLSPDGGIYMSLAMPEPSDRQSMELLTAFVGVCVCEAVLEVCGIECGIKWVNDVYVEGRKLAGILVERIDSYVVVGVGINGTVTPEVAGDLRTTSLVEHVADPCLEAVCASVARRLVGGLREGFDAGAVLDECRRRSVLLGCEVCYVLDGETRRGVARGIDDDGALVVRIGRDEERITSVAGNVRLSEASCGPASGLPVT